MTRYGFLGVVACVAGGALLGLQAISDVVVMKGGWTSLSIADVVGPEHFAWLADALPVRLESMARYAVAMPLYILLFALGGLLFILDYFLGRR